MAAYSRKSETDHRADIVEVCRRVYQKGFAAASDGNVSVRLGENRILMTPSGLQRASSPPTS